MTDQLLIRIENLERQNKRMRVIVSGLSLCLVGLLTMGYVLPQKTESRMERIDAKEVVLSDGRYSTVIRPEGMICSRDGVPRYDLVVREIGASIAFKNASGLMGSMLDESIMALMDDKAMVSMRPEHIFLQKGEADTLLTSSSLKTKKE